MGLSDDACCVETAEDAPAEAAPSGSERPEEAAGSGSEQPADAAGACGDSDHDGAMGFSDAEISSMMLNLKMGLTELHSTNQTKTKT